MLTKHGLKISMTPKHLSVQRQENRITSALNIPDKCRHSPGYLYVYVIMKSKKIPVNFRHCHKQNAAEYLCTAHRVPQDAVNSTQRLGFSVKK